MSSWQHGKTWNTYGNSFQAPLLGIKQVLKARGVLALLYPTWQRTERCGHERSIKGCVGQCGLSSLSVSWVGSLCKHGYLNRWRRMSQPSRNKLSNSVTLLQLGSSPCSSFSSLYLFSDSLVAPLLTKSPFDRRPLVSLCPHLRYDAILLYVPAPLCSSSCEIM
jgi:hypothetical protein